MATDLRLMSERFPRASAYNPAWVIANSMGSNALWIAEWLASGMELKRDMRVLDLGCGRGATSVFLAREFGVRVWAADLWISAAENIQRIRDAGVEDRVMPLHVDARGLPFAPGYFDAITCIDAFSYFGTDDLYLNYLANFVRPGGQIGVAGAGLAEEISGAVPEHLRGMWTQDFWCLHSAAWWRRHWERTGIVSIDAADSMEEAWKVWLEWQETAHPMNTLEIETVRADRGRYLSYIRMIGRRRADAKLEEYCWPDSMRSMPVEYKPVGLLRD